MIQLGSESFTLRHPFTYFLEVNIKIFSAGIFSVEGGFKAWFELLLVIAAICTTGGLIWWQIPWLILGFFLGTWCAGFLMLATPDFYAPERHSVVRPVSKILDSILETKLEQAEKLSGTKLEEFIENIGKIELILYNKSYLVFRVPDIENFERKVQESKRVARSNLEREKVQKEKKKREQKYKDEKYQDWLVQERQKHGYTGGAPMISGNPPKCQPGYPIKVTRNHPRDGYDGIIWTPADLEYDGLSGAVWCYQSVEAAKAEGGYRFRHPKKKRKKKK